MNKNAEISGCRNCGKRLSFNELVREYDPSLHEVYYFKCPGCGAPLIRATDKNTYLLPAAESTSLTSC